MLKTRDVPRELKNFNSLFSSFGYKYDLYRLFDDFLTIVCCCLAHQTQEKLYLETIRGYERKELDVFCKLFAELVMIYSRETHTGWYDPLGSYYEALSSSSKSKRFGQFFTPESLCEILVRTTIKENEWGKEIYEPASGSGRLILAANNHAKGNKYTAGDIDPICCKMTAINMCFHEIRGVVLEQNMLTLEKPRRIFTVNHNYGVNKTLSIFWKSGD